MPISHHWQDRTFVIRCVGEYSANDLIATFEREVAEPNFPADARICLDVRNAESMLRRRVEEMRRVTERFIIHAPKFGNRIALLVEGLARYGLMRMAAAWTSFKGVEAEIFFEEEDALAWLAGTRE